MILDTPELVELPLEQIHPADDNVRQKIGDVKELAASITAVGILEPIVVVPNGDGYTIVAGARRHAAAKVAKLSTVPCVVRPEMSTADRVEAMVIENLQRVDLTPLEEADAYQRLVNLDWTQRKIADRVGCTQPHVSKRLTLLELPAEVRTRIDDGRLPLDVGVKLVTYKKADPKGFERYIKSNPAPSDWSVQHKIDDARAKKRQAKLAKPYIDRGLKHLGQNNWSKYESCTKKQASAFYFSWNDHIEFVREKPATNESSSSTPASPPKETKKQREAREAREREQLVRVGALQKIVDDADPATAAYALSLLVLDQMLDQRETEEIELLCGVLNLPFVRRNHWDVDTDPIVEYVRASIPNARRAGMAAFIISAGLYWGDVGVQAHALTLLRDHGAELAERETEIVTASAEWTPRLVRTCRICGCTEAAACDGGCSWVDNPADKGDLCSSCVDAVNTVHDPDCPTSGAEIRADSARKDQAFAEEHDLQPGDEAHDDGSITRAANLVDG